MRKFLWVLILSLILLFNVGCNSDINERDTNNEITKVESGEYVSTGEADENLLDRHKEDLEYFKYIDDYFDPNKYDKMIKDLNYFKTVLLNFNVNRELKVNTSELETLKSYYQSDEDLHNDIDLLIDVYSDYDKTMLAISKYNTSQLEDDLKDVRECFIILNGSLAFYILQVDALDGTSKSLNKQQDERAEEYYKNMEENEQKYQDDIDGLLN